jgi:hypothetical protein
MTIMYSNSKTAEITIECFAGGTDDIQAMEWPNSQGITFHLDGKHIALTSEQLEAFAAIGVAFGHTTAKGIKALAKVIKDTDYGDA